VAGRARVREQVIPYAAPDTSLDVRTKFSPGCVFQLRNCVTGAIIGARAQVRPAATGSSRLAAPSVRASAVVRHNIGRCAQMIPEDLSRSVAMHESKAATGADAEIQAFLKSSTFATFALTVRQCFAIVRSFSQRSHLSAIRRRPACLPWSGGRMPLRRTRRRARRA